MVLESHPDVTAAAVIGVIDATWGEVGHAFVELGQPADAEDILRWCKERMANYKVPKKITVMDAIPRTTVDRVDYSLLKKMLEKGQ